MSPLHERSPPSGYCSHDAAFPAKKADIPSTTSVSGVPIHTYPSRIKQGSSATSCSRLHCQPSVVCPWHSKLTSSFWLLVEPAIVTLLVGLHENVLLEKNHFAESGRQQNCEDVSVVKTSTWPKPVFAFGAIVARTSKNCSKIWTSVKYVRD